MENFILILMPYIAPTVSAIAAIFSCRFACRTRKMQLYLLANKNDIDILHETISKLKIARALQGKETYSFSDEAFIDGIDLSNIQSQIVILKQNEALRKKLEDINWNTAFHDLEKTIDTLEQCWYLLFK